MQSLEWSDMAGRLGAALLAGALIGLERERKHRPAGFRTMILVSLGSAIFTIMGWEVIAEAHSELKGGAVPGADMSRVLQGLMGGIGFLGAGAVIQSKKAVRGMTTAAAVWVVAGIGGACGLGLYKLVVLAGAMALFTLIILEVVEDKYFPDGEFEGYYFPDKKPKDRETRDRTSGEPDHDGDEPSAGRTRP